MDTARQVVPTTVSGIITPAIALVAGTQELDVAIRACLHAIQPGAWRAINPHVKGLCLPPSALCRLRVALGPPIKRLTRVFAKNLPANAAAVVFSAPFKIPMGSLSVGPNEWIWIKFGVSYIYVTCYLSRGSIWLRQAFGAWLVCGSAPLYMGNMLGVHSGHSLLVQLECKYESQCTSLKQACTCYGVSQAATPCMLIEGSIHPYAVCKRSSSTSRLFSSKPFKCMAHLIV